MWKVYLLEFIVVLIISIIWANLLDKSKDYDANENDDFFI